jgi:hypothetical protein
MKPTISRAIAVVTTTLMSAFKMSGALFRSAAADGTGRRMDAQGRRQDLKTPVEQALMRGLDTA